LLRGDRRPTRAFVEPTGALAIFATPKPAADIPAAPGLPSSNPVVTITPNLAGLLQSDRLPVRPFVAPPIPATASAALNVDADPPVASQFMGANSTIMISDPNLAALLRNDRRPTKPFQPPPQVAPSKNTGAQTLAAPPQIATSDLRASSVIGLLSLPDTPVYVAVAAIPPANQISALGPTGSGGVGNGSAGASTSKEATSVKPAGSSPEDLPLRGTTQLSFPKDGKFGAVVLGSSAATPYIESVGALSGKFVYSAFVSVGLRKKWILQYSLSKTEDQELAEKGRAEALEAPWPYRIVRPDQIGAGSVNYILVRGVLTVDGRFDHLALLFPTELDNSDLLMRALKQWIFRPASRDGEPTQVDILLIIPTQPD
jgi:hypothetical protein